MTLNISIEKCLTYSLSLQSQGDNNFFSCLKGSRGRKGVDGQDGNPGPYGETGLPGPPGGVVYF